MMVVKAMPQMMAPCAQHNSPVSKPRGSLALTQPLQDSPCNVTTPAATMLSAARSA